MGTPADNKPDIIRKLPVACVYEDAAVHFLETMRWDDEPRCAHCDSADVYKMQDRDGGRNKRYLWRCRACRKQYTVRVGTVMEESRIPLKVWCHAFWRACSSKKGVSALQIQRETGLSYKSALFMMHRIRYAMADDLDGPPRKLQGTIEIDETYVGGKPRYRNKANVGGRSTSTKTPVVALVERGGDVRAFPMQRLTQTNLHRAVRELVDDSARIITDEWAGYQGLGGRFAGGHHTVKHSAREYVRPGTDIYTNTIESFFSRLKRAVYGTHHSISKRHLHRYVSECAFKHNTRHLDDGERTRAAIRKGEGKRLRYREPIAR